MHIKLIDANSIGFAQHHANDLRHAGALQTQAVAGMLQHVRRNLQHDPTVLNVLIWDGRAQWRYDLYPTYKSGRHRTVEQREARRHYELQRPWIERALSYFPVLQVKHPRGEADDLAWGLSRQLSAQGHLVTVHTSDTDWLQMVNPRVRWLNARKPSQLVEMDTFHRLSGFATPAQVAQVKALMGDASDDIEGVPDVAEKRAASLLGKYGSLDAVLAAATDFMQFSQEPKFFHSLMLPQWQDAVKRNLQLVDLSLGPVLQGSDVELVVGEFDELNLFELFVDLDFRQMQDGFDSWRRTLNTALAAADVNSVKRAVANVAKSWDRPANV